MVKLVQIGDSKFYYSLFPRNYDECKAAAAAYNLSLPSIHSDEENELIFNELRNYSTWIGGYQTGPNTFAWEDKSPWNYDNLSEGEHDNTDKPPIKKIAVNFLGKNVWNAETPTKLKICLFAENVSKKKQTGVNNSHPSHCVRCCSSVPACP